MLKITCVRRCGLEANIIWDGKKKTYYRRGYYFSWVQRINFVRDGLHYSIQLGDDDESTIELRCKEDKTFYRVLGYGTRTILDLLFGWDWNTLGTTYKTFPAEKLEAFIFGDK